MGKRVAWVDYAKAIGIFLVVFGHVERGIIKAGLPIDRFYVGLFDNVIYSFHMPLFFFISALYFRASLLRSGGSSLILDKVGVVLWPYVIWSLIQGFVEVGLSRYTNGNVSFLEVLYFPWHPRAQFWFLYALFILQVVGVLIYSRLDAKWFPAIFVLFCFLFVYKDSVSDSLIVGYVTANICFFAFGVWFNEIVFFVEKNKTKILCVSGFLFFVGQYLINFVYGLSYESAGLPMLLLASVSIVFVVSFAMCLSQFDIKILSFLGRATLPIYLMHIISGSGARVILLRVFGIESGLVHLVFGTFVGLMAPLVAKAIFDRFRLSYLFFAPVFYKSKTNIA